MSSIEESKSVKKCLNCCAELNNDFQFCPACGQATENEATLKSFFTHFLSDYFTFDSKIVRSITPLLSNPGTLTNEYIKGKRVSYIPPLRLYIFTSLIFFLLLNWLNQKTIIQSNDISIDDQFWNLFFGSYLPKLFFILLPIFALIISLLYRKKQKSMLPHFLFAFHYHSAAFLSGIIYVPISWFFKKMEWQTVNVVTLLLLGIYLIIILWKGLKTVYKENTKKTSWKYLVLFGSYTICVIVSSIILLLFTL